MIEFSALHTVILTPYFLITIGIVPLVYLLNLFAFNAKKLNLPSAGPAKNGILVPSFLEASKKYPNQPFILPESVHPYVVLPLSLLDEVKALPDSSVSLLAEVSRKLHGKYTTIGTAQDAFTKAVKVEMNRKHTDTIIANVQDEISHAFDTYYESYPEWTEVAAYPKLLMVIAALSARIFVGLPLCRDQAWLGSTITFTMNIMATSRAIAKIHPLLRAIRAPFLPEVKVLNSCLEVAAKKLEPYFKPAVESFRQTMKLRAGAKVVLEDEEEGKLSVLTWILNHEKNPETVTSKEMAREQMSSISFASIHTTGLRTINCIFDLAAHPEIADELREEYETVLKEDCNQNGKLTRQGLLRLRKLDSFMLESVRCNPSALTNMVRMVVAPNGITLSTGVHFPYGTALCFPLLFSPYALNPPTDSPLLAESQPPLSEFHAFRFAKIREQPGNEDKFQFTSLGPENMSFGAGNHACPGRFFSSNNIKCMLVEMLKRYDIGVLEGGGGIRQGGKRPEPISSEMGWYINPGSKIWMRSRKM